MTFKTASAIVFFLSAGVAEAQNAARSPVPLKEAKLNIEYNATAKDIGFQGAVDSEGWQQLSVTGPGGTVLKFEATGRLKNFGLTELFFETVEPATADVPMAQVLARLPEGDYEIYGPTTEPPGSLTVGTAHLTHTIPKGTNLLSPPEGSSVPLTDLIMKWTPVTRTIDGKLLTIIAYQLIVEKAGNPHPNMIGKPNSLSMYLSPSVTRMTVPKAFLVPAANYDWEVLAIEASGSQTLTSGKFSTQ